MERKAAWVKAIFLIFSVVPSYGFLKAVSNKDEIKNFSIPESISFKTSIIHVSEPPPQQYLSYVYEKQETL